MKRRSILLPVTGSQESLYAAEFAWSLARQVGSAVTAQHVVDTHGALEFVSHEKPGFMGSGPYLAAYESVCGSLSEVADKLEQAYEARVGSMGIKSEFLIEEGEPLGKITARANDHDFIIVGHRQRPAASGANCQVARLSLAETLSHATAVPLFVVQAPVRQVSEFSIFSSMDHINILWLKSCLRAAETIGATASINFLASGKHEQTPVGFVRSLRDANPELAHTRIVVVGPDNDGQPARIFCPQTKRRMPGPASELIVVPTVDQGEHRLTASFGECPTALLRRVSFGAVLLWPEEHCKPLFSEEESLLSA